MMQLPIFPVVTAARTSEITYLSSSVFVLDSEFLNAFFKNKVDILDFGDNHIWDIIPVFRCSRVNLKYLSTYNDPTTINVKVLEPVTIDMHNLGILWKRRAELTRCKANINWR